MVYKSEFKWNEEVSIRSLIKMGYPNKIQKNTQCSKWLGAFGFSRSKIYFQSTWCRKLINYSRNFKPNGMFICYIIKDKQTKKFQKYKLTNCVVIHYTCFFNFIVLSITALEFGLWMHQYVSSDCVHLKMFRVFRKLWFSRTRWLTKVNFNHNHLVVKISQNKQLTV